MSALRAYKTLLHLYPYDYRAMFAAEMAAAFEEAAAERCSRGTAAIVRFTLAELLGLMVGAAAEWTAKLTSDNSIRGRHLPDRLRMRPPGVPWEAYYAGAFAGVPQSALSGEVTEAEKRVSFLVDRMVHAIAHHDFEGARSYSREERKERDNLRRLREKYQAGE